LIGMTLPNKVQSYMAAGKPILAAANGEIPKVLSAADCGFCAPAEDSTAFAQAVRQFLTHPDRAKLGENARNYYDNHFTRQMFMENLAQELTTLAQK
jgi:glycosyltransferase involved in cell wall biosynthesis